jgi:hypothetical protein
MKTGLKKTGIRVLIRLFAAVFLIAASAKGIAHAVRPHITLKADKQEVGIGETLKVTVEMSWKQPEDIAEDVIIIKVTPPSCPLLDMADSKQETSSRLAGDEVRAARIIEYYFTAKEKGEGIIEPAVIEYLEGAGQEYADEDRKIIRSESINVKVVSHLSSAGRRLVTGVVFIGIAVLITAAGLFFKKNIRNPGRRKVPENTGSQPEKEFLGSFKLFNKYKIEGNYAKFYTCISGALAGYISKKYSVPMTAIHGGNEPGKLPQELEKLYTEWTAMEGKIRFSGYRPQKNELERIIRETERYFKNLIPDAQAEEIMETIS